MKQRAAFAAFVVSVLVCQAAASQFEAAQLAPPRPELVAVPLPRLDGMEPLVSSQIREELQAFADRTAGRPSDAELGRAYGSLARLFHVYELFEAAEAAYANAVRLARGEVEWLHLLGYLYEQTGRLEEAAETFGAVRFAGPRGNASAIRLAEVWLRLNRLRDAREQFQSLVATFPAIAQNGLGEVALREGRFAEAIAHFRAALGRVPQATTLHYSLAMAYRGLGKLEEARAHLDQRGSGGIRIGDPIVERLQTLVRGERGLVLQGRRAYDEGRFEDAAAAFRDALDAAPDSVGARANLGLALSQLGDEAGAAEQFEAVLRLDAGNVIAHASLGTLLARQRRDTEAVDHLRAAFEQTPRDPNLRRQLVGALLRLGQPARAIDALERARSFSPDDEDLVVGLAILLADQQRYADAVARLDAAYQRFPERTATATTLARLLASAPDLALRNGERALTLATAVYESDPAAAHAETVAMSLAELGRCDEAAAWMRRAVTQAERAKDAPELARLKGEMLRYGSACRR